MLPMAASGNKEKKMRQRRKTVASARDRRAAWKGLITLTAMIMMVVFLCWAAPSNAQHDGFEQAEALSVDLEPIVHLSDQQEGLSEWSGYFGTATLSQYFGANGASFYGDPVQQSFFTLTCGAWNFDVWHSSDVEDSDLWENDFGHELDLTLFWTRSLGQYDVTAGVAWFILADIAGGDVVRPYVEVGRSFRTSSKYSLRPYVSLETYESTTSVGPTPGQAYHFGLGHVVSFSERVGLAFKTEAFYDTGAFDFESGLVWLINGQITWNISSKLALNAPVFKCGGGLSVDDRPSDCSVGVGIGVPVSFSRR